MKRFWILVLLISVGLNLGLGWRLLQVRRQVRDQSSFFSGDSGRGGGRGWQGRDRRGDGLDVGRGGGRGRFLHAPEDTAAARLMMERRLERLTEKLGLDPAQRESFLAAHREAAPRFWEHKRRVSESRRKLHDAIMQSPVQPDGVWAAMRELGRCQAALDSLATAGMLRELDSLDPRQREEYLRTLPWSAKPPRGE